MQYMEYLITREGRGKNLILNSIVVVGFPDLLELIVFAAIFGNLQ